MPQKHSPRIDADTWEPDGPYSFTHPNDWTITNRIISAKSVWLLRHAADEHGSFKSADEAMRRHAELLRASSAQR
jgi:hypothetical protein